MRALVLIAILVLASLLPGSQATRAAAVFALSPGWLSST